MPEEEQIERLKEIALSSGIIDLRKKAIDAIATYGEKGILAIADVVDSSVTKDVREHGLEKIKKIKESS